LNDPFELKPSFASYKKSIKDYVRNEFKLRAVDFDKLSYIEQESKIQKLISPSIDKMAESLKEFLILSLTKKEENLLMWSHYADSHRGLVIGFDYDNSFFHPTIDFKLSKPFEVKYSNNRPMFFNYDKIRARNAPFEDIRILLTTKSLWWEYEEEIRMFANPKATNSVGKDNYGFDIYLVNFPTECLKKIIFGSLMNSSEKMEISEIAKRLYPHAEILESLPSSTEFTLKFKPYKI
jgi:hypothetical protein